MGFDLRVFGLAIMQDQSRVIDPAESKEDMSTHMVEDFCGVLGCGNDTNVSVAYDENCPVVGQLYGEEVIPCLIHLMSVFTPWVGEELTEFDPPRWGYKFLNNHVVVMGATQGGPINA
jgi:hypothetical protein